MRRSVLLLVFGQLLLIGCKWTGDAPESTGGRVDAVAEELRSYSTDNGLGAGDFRTQK